MRENEKMTVWDNRNKHKKLNNKKKRLEMTEKVMTRISNGLIRK